MNAMDDRAQHKGRHAHPAPLVPARPAVKGELPRTALSLVKRAEALGWRTWVTYAQGWTLPSPGTDSHIASSVVVRLFFAPAGARAVAVWTESRFETAFIWAEWMPLEQVGARAVASWVASVPERAVAS